MKPASQNPMKPKLPLRIEKHRLLGADGTPVRFVESPNHGGLLEPRYLLMHYTAGVSHLGTMSWFLNPEARVSAHVVIGRGGELIQMVPFNAIAWHAGPDSIWTDRENSSVARGLNKCSIGIELVNLGRLERDKATKKWKSAKPVRFLEDDDVRVMGTTAWQRYTEEQLAMAEAVGALLCKHYGLRDTMGHEDVCPGRKTDPGPAFPMAQFRALMRKAAGLDNVV